MTEQKRLYKIHVSGRVQGVGFRWSAVHQAQSLGLTGLVRNLPDGRVYIEAEGVEQQLDAFLQWCHKGPGWGFVESVSVVSCAPSHYRDFRIDY
ncbi:acylphosphatase [bacterium]|nr:acylphosphatase [bacterium]